VFQSLWKKFDLFFFLLIIALVSYGLVLIYSATSSHGPSLEFKRQLLYFIFGLILMIFISLLDYEIWDRIYAALYWLILVLLTAVMLVGHETMGAQRWISLGPLGTFQPSEFAKWITIIVLAHFLSRWEFPNNRPLVYALIFMAPPLLLILKQPDLGTTLVLLAIAAAMFYAAGVRGWIIVVSGILGSVAFSFFLKDYQRERLFSFINPAADPHGSGWNLIQAKIAIGSGGIFGKGLFAGTQTQLKFVPENYTDFIFTVLGEELGLWGGLILFILFFVLIQKSYNIARVAPSRFGYLAAVGISTMFLFHCLVNIGMTVGIMPITGIPLLFISYGGSALLTNLICVGMLFSIYLRREKIF
jgi:rod shape determining protein RodA